MIDDVEIQLNGRTFTWSCDLDAGHPANRYRWIDAEFKLVPTVLANALNSEFIRNHAESIAVKLEQEQGLRFVTVLQSMGARDADFASPVMLALSEIANCLAARRSGAHFSAPAKSPLKILGYCVGQSGLPPTKRRAILRAAFEGELPDNGGPVEDWGNPGSPDRYSKICSNLSSYSWNARSKQSPSAQAIADWDEDLKWFQQEYQQRVFDS